MKENEIIEVNKLIAEYMGAKYVSGAGWEFGIFASQYSHNRGKLKFHTSWDWLRPVIVKIINQNRLKTVDECTEEEWFQITRITRMYIGIDIELAHHYVVEYIKWFNQQK